MLYKGWKCISENVKTRKAVEPNMYCKVRFFHPWTYCHTMEAHTPKWVACDWSRNHQRTKHSNRRDNIKMIRENEVNTLYTLEFAIEFLTVDFIGERQAGSRYTRSAAVCPGRVCEIGNGRRPVWAWCVYSAILPHLSATRLLSPLVLMLLTWFAPAH